MCPKSSLPGLNEMRTNLRRKQILGAAILVFAEKGYHRATTKEIARRAKTAEGTIYLYFKNKAELLIALMEELDQVTTRPSDLDEGTELSMRALLIKRLANDLGQLGSNFDLVLAILPEILADSHLRPQYYQRLIVPGINNLTEHLQKRTQQHKEKISDIPMAVRIFLATLLGLEILHILGDEVIREAWKNPAQLAEHIARVLFDGLQPERR